MNRRRVAHRTASAIAAASALVAAALAVGVAGGAPQDPGSNPAEGDLLRTPAFDRLTLIDGTELRVDPVTPRPLPSREEIKAAAEKTSERFERVGGLMVGKLPELRHDPSENAIVIRTQGADARDYYVKLLSIKSAEYFEEMLLADAQRRARSGDFSRAFELVLAVRSRAPEWPGLQETADQITLLEGRDALDRRRVDQGLRILGELYARNPEFPGLAEELAKGYEGRVGSAIEQGAYALGRRVLVDLKALAPDRPEVGRIEKRFVTKAQALAEQAEALEGADRTARLADALRVWPHDQEIADRYRVAFEAAPVLDVAVLDVPRRPGPFIECPADARLMGLLYRSILDEATEAAAKGVPPDQIAAELRVSDIGRRLELTLKPGIVWNDGTREVGAADVARALSDRALPSNAGYDARWADLLDRVIPIGPRDLEVSLKRAPLDPAAWLLLPVGPAHAGRDGLVWTPEGPEPIGSGAYTIDDLTPSTAQIGRVADSSEGSPTIARIVERRYDAPADPVAVLLRGDVALLERVPPSRIADLEEAAEIKLGRYRNPRMHWIAIDGRNPFLQNRSLRRALSVAIDRVELLRERVYRGTVAPETILSDGPFPVDLDANATDVEPIVFDPLLAKMLVRGAKREMTEDTIALTFAYPSTPEARAIVKPLVEMLEAAGLAIEAIERAPSDLERGLRDGERFDLAYRSGIVDDPIRDIGPLLCPGYAAPPSSGGLGAIASPRILQLLLRLEQVQDLQSAQELVRQIDREVRDELPILPLWQLTEHYAWRDRLQGPAPEADLLYQGIESWSIAPWYADSP